ncbi:unnamed protein product [Calypogeia fissa]
MSPVRKVKQSGRVRRVDSESPVPGTQRRGGKELSVSPAREDHDVSPDIKEEESPVHRDTSPSPDNETSTLSELPKREVSSSPPRSLSVSLNHSLKKDLESDDDVDVSSRARKRSTRLGRVESDDDDDDDDRR